MSVQLKAGSGSNMGKSNTNKVQTIIYILIILGIIGVINYVSVKKFKRLDLTEEKPTEKNQDSAEDLFKEEPAKETEEELSKEVTEEILSPRKPRIIMIIRFLRPMTESAFS